MLIIILYKQKISCGYCNRELTTTKLVAVCTVVTSFMTQKNTLKLLVRTYSVTSFELEKRREVKMPGWTNGNYILSHLCHREYSGLPSG
jgi:hypothetical protein